MGVYTDLNNLYADGVAMLEELGDLMAELTGCAGVESGDITFSFVAASGSVPRNAGTYTFKVRLNTLDEQPLSAPASVQVNVVSGGTAQSGTHYTFSSPATITFEANSASGATKTVTLTVIDTSAPQGDMTVTFRLSPVTAGLTSTHTVTITGNNPVPDLQLGSFGQNLTWDNQHFHVQSTGPEADGDYYVSLTRAGNGCFRMSSPSATGYTARTCSRWDCPYPTGQTFVSFGGTFDVDIWTCYWRSDTPFSVTFDAQTV